MTAWSPLVETTAQKHQGNGVDSREKEDSVRRLCVKHSPSGNLANRNTGGGDRLTNREAPVYFTWVWRRPTGQVALHSPLCFLQKGSLVNCSYERLLPVVRDWSGPFQDFNHLFKELR